MRKNGAGVACWPWLDPTECVLWPFAWIERMVAPRRLTDSVLVESIVSMFERKTPDVFDAQMNAMLNRHDATELLGRMRCPTLV